LPEHHDDSPYRDARRATHTTSRAGSRGHHRKPAAKHKAHKAHGHAAHGHEAHGHGAQEGRHGHQHTASAHPVRKRKRRRRAKGTAAAKVHSTLTSHPTTRNAVVATRAWLLKQHGPVCAYCGSSFAARTMTLDHVAPRRGQKAYDRRDNLVLACRACNMAKRDLAPLAFMLGLRSRAANLLKYGAHLSHGLLELARSLVPDDGLSSGARNTDNAKWGASTDPDEDSPYRD
jgi:5-methylcytosine-specific restriction endonuclease McrA